MKLGLLCDAAGIACPATEREREIRAIETDSRRVTDGSLFVCIRGFHADGHDFIEDVMRAGAVAAVTERGRGAPDLHPGLLLLESDDTRRATAYLYDAWYGFPSRRLRLIGVTGTNGKTSVTHMLRAILEGALFRCGLIGTVGCESVGRHLDSRGANDLANMTTPDPPELYRMLWQMAEDGVEYVLMEVTSHALTLQKLAPLTFEAAIFTNLTPEHLDFHKTMEAYANAKATLFEKSRLSVVNLDSPFAETMIRHASGRVVTCGIRREADFRAETVRDDGEGVIYELRSGSSRQILRCPIPGEFSVTNSMQAAVTAMQLGVSVGSVKASLSALSGVKGRMERVKLGLGADFTVLIDYAHTPDALENLLRTASPLRGRGGRLILLFGCGGDRDRGKRPVMGRVASDNADLVIVTSDNSRSEDATDIINEITVGMREETPRAVIVDRAAAIGYAIDNARAGDVVLLAGKGHEEYEITSAGRRHFDEREIVRQAFARRRKRNEND